MYAQRLQIQERLTHQVAQAIAAVSSASGVMVVCSAAHMCMVARGVENHASMTTTVASLGRFQLEPALRKQLLQLAAASSGTPATRGG